MSVSWAITDFQVQTSTADRVTDRLYANGNMQVTVIVTINAINPDTWATHQLTDAELKKIQLIDFYSGAALTGTWFYSTTANDFAHTLTGARDPVEPSADAAQSIRFYVSSTKIENQVIGARITQPDKTVVTTNSTAHNSSVTLTGLQPVVYTTNNIAMSDKKKEAAGNWTYTVRQSSSSNSYSKDWQQDNYYVTSDVHPILQADLHEYKTNSSTMTNSFDLRYNKYDLHVFYFWEPGVETSEKLGNWDYSHYVDYDDRGHVVSSVEYTRDATAKVQVNQQKNAFCLTHMAFFHTREWSQKAYSLDAWVRLYDTYGNYGDFYVRVKEDTDENGAVDYTLYLQNKNTPVATGSSSLDPTAKL